MHYCYWCTKRIEGHPVVIVIDGVKKKFHAGPLKDCISIYERRTKDLETSAREGGS